MIALLREFDYDTSYIKKLELRMLRAMLLRAGLMLACGAAGFWLMQDQAFMWWGGLYGVATALWVWLLRGLPQRVGRFRFAVMLLVALAYGFSYQWIIYYAWGQPDPVMHYVALIAIAGAMLNAVSLRSDDLLMSLSDMILIMLAVPWMLIHHFQRIFENKNQAVFLAILMGALILYLVVAIRDASRARDRLRQTFVAEMEQAKLQSLGQLTGGVAHDFNNLLTVIIGNLDLHRTGDLPPEDQAQLLAEVHGAARKASELTAHLLAYSRRSPLEEKVVDVRDVIDSAGVLLRRLLPATHALSIRSADTLPRIRVDAGKLETVVVNLVMNARDAMPSGGAISIDVALSPPDGDALSPGAPPYVCMRVADTGTGIPPEILAKVLEPYFTTKPVGKGSGLGLPMAMGFAEQSGGKLTIDSVEGAGTTVSLWFPAAANNAAEDPSEHHRAA